MAVKGSKFRKYNKSFKLKVVKDYLSCESGGFRTITKKYKLPDKSRVQDWLKLYQEYGEKAFDKETRGRNSRNGGRKKQIKLEEMTLEEQVEYLKMEVDILKKVKALQKD